MKRLLVLAALVAVAVGVTPARADDMVSVGDVLALTDPVPANGTQGGPWLADNQTNLAAPDFLTFCLELDEFLNVPGNVTVIGIGTTSFNGGVGQAGDPLNPETAYIYTMFRQGAVGFTNGDDVQNAIWYFETLGETTTGGSNNAVAQAASAAVAGGQWSGLGSVRVLNISSAAGPDGRGQDLLTIPEPGSLMLLGIGLVGLAGAARRRMR
jgi:hypothetical protein